ncbi:MAG: hypothetical protein GXP31_08750 [Kiritimatiellaeota bacterium]|nr:hypothetical protein [Kiritimatiellota bacterium]
MLRNPALSRMMKRALLVSLFVVSGGALRGQVTLETGAFGIRLAANGRVESVFVKPGDRVVATAPKGRSFLRLRQGGRVHAPSALLLEGQRLTATFASAGAEAVLKVDAIDAALHLAVEKVTGTDVTQLVFADLSLSRESHAAGWGLSVAALNEFTLAIGHPGMGRVGRATAFSRFGFERGEAAVIVARRRRMREILKAVVESAPGIPKSRIGGPFAMDAPGAHGSYLFAGRNVTEANVDEVIELADRLGLNQINMNAVRYGDWKPDATRYPAGRASLKRVIDRIHAAGMLAGVHTYSEFLSKSTPYVTPVPDRRLGVDAVFTLAAPLDASAETVPVVETTETMSATTGFFLRNSATLRIGDELIVYRGVSKTAPFAFTRCRRGALGTKIAAHAKGAKVYHLRECFGLFVPDGDSTLFDEVARNLADMINECGFDMLYLDALDGSDAVAGRAWAWHYAAKFTLEVFRHLKRPVLAEMSTFPHHLWYVRSRAGAWDHPNRSHKTFIDIHATANRKLEQIFLPAHLGWWRYKTWHSFSQEPTYFDDIELLGARCLGTGSGVSIQGVSPTTLRTVPALARLASITRQYEVLRRAKYFDAAVCEQLRRTGAEFALRQNEKGRWELRPSAYLRHKTTGDDDGSRRWIVANAYGAQVPFLRIQALHSVRPYDTPTDLVLAEFAEAGEFSSHKAVRAVRATLETATEPVKAGSTGAVLTAANTGKPGAPSWARWSKVFDPPADLTGRQGMGLWVLGDGKGEILNLQLRSPVHLTYAYGEHYIKVDFTGWRYFELVEPDGEDYRNAVWPYRSWYAVYRSTPRYNAIRELNLYVNKVPPGETVRCVLSPVRCLPLVESPIINPRIAVGGRSLVFPVAIPTGCCLEYDGVTARLFGRQGRLLEVVKPEGDRIRLMPGKNTVEFSCNAPEANVRARAMVTVGLFGDPLKNRRNAREVKWAEMAREIDAPRQIIAMDGAQNRWTTVSREAGKRVTLDFELIVQSVTTTTRPHESSNALVIDSFDDLATFANSPDNNYLQYVVSGERSGVPTAEGVVHELTVERRSKKFGIGSFRYTAKARNGGGWCARGRRFAKPLDLTGQSRIGFWIRGDGLGETLYFQLRDAKGAHFDMKTPVTFTGWRFVSFELRKQNFDFSAVEYLILYYNGLPPGREVNCQVDAMHAYRAAATFRDPALRVGRRKLIFPIALRSGDVLEYTGATGACEVRRGAERIAVAPRGKSPKLKRGINKLELTAATDPGADIALTVQVMKRYRTKK